MIYIIMLLFFCPQFLYTYMEISKELGDTVGLGKAYEAMAKALER